MKQNRFSYTLLNLEDYKISYHVWIQGYDKEDTLTSYSELISKHERMFDAITSAEDFETKKVYKRMEIPDFVEKLKISIELVHILKDDYEEPQRSMGSKIIKIK